jgi:hypothetical protein
MVRLECTDTGPPGKVFVAKFAEIKIFLRRNRMFGVRVQQVVARMGSEQ